MIDQPKIAREIMELFCVVLQDSTRRVRFELRNRVVTDWSETLIHPSPSYLEIAQFGPFRTADILKCQIDVEEPLNSNQSGQFVQAGFVAIGNHSYEKTYSIGGGAAI